MLPVYICDATRTPIGRYGGSLSSIRTDDLAAIPIRALIERHPSVDWEALDDVVLGCANQAGEDNRNVARMALLLAGLPVTIPGVTVNRLCGSGMDAVAVAARAIGAGEADLVLAGGVESMSRAPFVLPKAAEPFARQAEIHDTTMGWRFVNPRMKERYGVDTMPQTGENVAEAFGISREDQDAFALWSQQKASAAQSSCRFKAEISPVTITRPKADPILFGVDEHPRATTREALAALKTIVKPDGTITAGNASGINDGAAALILASERAVARHNLSPRARVLGSSVSGVEPRLMGIGPVTATRRLLQRVAVSLAEFDVLELNEAFAAQAIACTRQLGLDDEDPRINPLGGAIALGHPLGMTGARMVASAMHQLHHTRGRRALCAMCVGVGQGIAMAIERVH